MPVAGCEHRKFRLLFVLEKPGEWKYTGSVLSELSAVNARMPAFARHMAKRGHRVQVADAERISQVLRGPHFMNDDAASAMLGARADFW
jgi:hypothetical protein